MADRALAALLQPRLKTSGPAPQLPHIEAAILIARDALGAREACRAVPDVPETVNGRVNKLAGRVRSLLSLPEFGAVLTAAPPQLPSAQSQGLWRAFQACAVRACSRGVVRAR